MTAGCLLDVREPRLLAAGRGQTDGGLADGQDDVDHGHVRRLLGQLQSEHAISAGQMILVDAPVNHDWSSSAAGQCFLPWRPLKLRE